jgi:predicted ribosomally synthesized peptide with SipW-like signal peptide
MRPDDRIPRLGYARIPVGEQDFTQRGIGERPANPKLRRKYLMSVLPKNKKVTVGIGIAAAAAALIALGGGTYAAFSDTETGPGGTLAAGTLDLEVGSTPTTTPLFTATGIAPGYTSGDYTITYKNAGTIDGTLSLALGVANAENLCVEPEVGLDSSCGPTEGELGQALVITVNGPGGLNYTGPLNGLAGGPTPFGTVAAGQSAQYTVSYTLPVGVGNEVQSDGVAVTTTATLNQATP